MPNYGYHFARAKGTAIRTVYRLFLSMIARSDLPKRTDIPVNVVSYCGEQTLPEQVASIRSFLRHVGHPKQFTVVSDGTLSQRSTEILKSLGSMISISESQQWLPKNRYFLRTVDQGTSKGTGCLVANNQHNRSFVSEIMSQVVHNASGVAHTRSGHDQAGPRKVIQSA